MLRLYSATTHFQYDRGQSADFAPCPSQRAAGWQPIGRSAGHHCCRREGNDFIRTNSDNWRLCSLVRPGEATARNACRKVATIHSGRLSYKSSNLRYKIERWRAHGRNRKGNEAIDPASLHTNELGITGRTESVPLFAIWVHSSKCGRYVRRPTGTACV